MQVAVVTGASRGFGLAVARGLATAGWALVLDARGELALEAAVGELSPVTTVRAIAGDITDAAHRSALVEAANGLGDLALVVNNAGALGPSPQPRLADYPLDALRGLYDVNVVAQLGVIQAALPSLRAAHAPVIVNVTSDAAREQYEGWGGYGSSKAALEQLGNVLAAEEPNVRVYTFDPGDMRTQMHQDAFPGEDISDRPEPESVVPAFLRLLEQRPASGRYRAAELEPVTA
jgi:NAD(P)-dependent dehydrogenase (short-subunit alcohol dehydrogenase family)